MRNIRSRWVEKRAITGHRVHVKLSTSNKLPKNFAAVRQRFTASRHKMLSVIQHL